MSFAYKKVKHIWKHCASNTITDNLQFKNNHLKKHNLAQFRTKLIFMAGFCKVLKKYIYKFFFQKTNTMELSYENLNINKYINKVVNP